MKLLAAMKHAGRFSYSPKYSLFHCSSTGEYTFIEMSTDPEKIVELFKSEAMRPKTCGLEIRCDGVRVDFNGT